MYIREREQVQFNRIIEMTPYCLAVLIVIGVRFRIFSIIALLVCAAFFLVYEEKTYLPVLFFLVPFANIFKLSAEGSSFFTYLVLLFVVLHYIKNRKPLRFVDVIIFLLSVFVCLNEVINLAFDIRRTIKFVSNILLLSFFVEFDDPQEVNKIFKYYVIGFIISGLIGLFGDTVVPINQYVNTQISRYSDGSEINRFAGLYSDPNYFTINIIICCVLTIALYEKKIISLIPFALSIFLLAFFIGKSGSKSALIMLIIPILVFFRLMRKTQNYIILFISFVAILVILYLMNLGKISLFEGAIRRFTIDSKGGIDQLSTGRYNIWVKYFEHFKTNLTGVIVGNGISADYLEKSATHNTYIDLIYQLGIIGTMLYIWIILDISRASKHIQEKKDIANFAIWATILIMYFFLSQLQEYDLPFQLALAIFWHNYHIDAPKFSNDMITKQKRSKYIYEL